MGVRGGDEGESKGNGAPVAPEGAEGADDHLAANVLACGDGAEAQHRRSLVAGQVPGDLLILLLTILLLSLAPVLLVVVASDVEQLLDLEDTAGASGGADLPEGEGGLPEGLGD